MTLNWTELVLNFFQSFYLADLYEAFQNQRVGIAAENVGNEDVDELVSHNCCTAYSAAALGIYG